MNATADHLPRQTFGAGKSRREVAIGPPGLVLGAIHLQNRLRISPVYVHTLLSPRHPLCHRTRLQHLHIIAASKEGSLFISSASATHPESSSYSPQDSAGRRTTDNGRSKRTKAIKYRPPLLSSLVLDGNWLEHSPRMGTRPRQNLHPSHPLQRPRPAPGPPQRSHDSRRRWRLRGFRPRQRRHHSPCPRRRRGDM